MSQDKVSDQSIVWIPLFQLEPMFKWELLVKRTIYSTAGQHRYLSEEMAGFFFFLQISSYVQLITNNQIVIHTEESLTKSKEGILFFLTILAFFISLHHFHIDTST